MPHTASSIRTGLAVAVMGFALGACGPGARSDAGSADTNAALDEREAARQDVQRMLRDVELETLAKRVTALEIEIEQIKAQQDGASTLELERRLAQLEVAPVAPPPPATAPTPPAVAKAPTKAEPASRTRTPSSGRTSAPTKPKPATPPKAGAAPKPKTPARASGSTEAPTPQPRPATAASKETQPKQPANGD